MFNILKKRLGIQEDKKEKVEILKSLLEKKIEGETMLDNRRDRINFEIMTEREIEECKKQIDELEELNDKKKETESR